MASIERAEIEHYAGELRAQEIRRVEHRVGAALLSGLVAVSEWLRPLFSWNPQRVRPTDQT